MYLETHGRTAAQTTQTGRGYLIAARPGRKHWEGDDLLLRNYNSYITKKMLYTVLYIWIVSENPEQL